jgi:type I restriction enzyme S subunit
LISGYAAFPQISGSVSVNANAERYASAFKAFFMSLIFSSTNVSPSVNHCLEQIAQAIFKSWFVDFEPFQNCDFIDSELGDIPKGWRVDKLSELVTIKYGKDHKKLADGAIPVFGSGGLMRFAEKALYREESVLIPRKGTLNNVMYVNQPFWTVDTMFFTEMTRSNLAKFVYFFVCSKDLASMNAGSAVPSMTTETLNALPVVIPPDEELARFEDIVGTQFSTIQDNLRENDALASLRDTLLPRLISGELSLTTMDAKQ